MRARDDGRPVVVGYDGSEASEAALRWGVDEARMRFVPLIVCHAWQWHYPHLPVTDETTEAVRRMGRRVLNMGVNLAHDLAPRVEVQGRSVMGSPSAALISASAAAELVVVGPRGSGAFEGLGIGSTTIQLAANARSPVAVVKESAHPRTHRVVVGVEGANPGGAELGLAFDEARFRQASLLAICLCEEGMDDTRQPAVRFYGNVAVWEEKYPQVVVETVVEMRPHTAVLQHAADRADLVMISDREQNDPVELPLGLVCQSVLREAPCAVMVIPARMSATSSH